MDDLIDWICWYLMIWYIPYLSACLIPCLLCFFFPWWRYPSFWTLIWILICICIFPPPLHTSFVFPNPPTPLPRLPFPSQVYPPYPWPLPSLPSQQKPSGSLFAPLQRTPPPPIPNFKYLSKTSGIWIPWEFQHSGSGILNFEMRDAEGSRTYLKRRELLLLRLVR